MWLVALIVPYCVEMGQKRQNTLLREVRVGDFREKSARIGAKKSAKNENCKVTVYYAIASEFYECFFRFFKEVSEIDVIQ